MSCNINTVYTRPYDLFKSKFTTSIYGTLYIGGVSTSATMSMSGDTVIIQTGTFSGISSQSYTVTFKDGKGNELFTATMTFSGISSTDNIILTIKLNYSKT